MQTIRVKMKGISILCVSMLFVIGNACTAQTVQNMETNHPLLCDTNTGICEVPGTTAADNGAIRTNVDTAGLKIIYFTDPICSSCWGIEPQLRKLKLEYGNRITVEYRMGGLLPDWSYNSGGISKPSDVATHWDEASLYYDMPIDGDVWLEHPLASSYPACIAFKAAQLQGEDKALHFMRLMREAVFMHKQNIALLEVLIQIARQANLEPTKFEMDYNGKARDLFNEDLQLGRTMGVRGFPTLFFTSAQAQTQVVYGSKPYADFEAAILHVLPGTLKMQYAKSWQDLFAKYGSLTAREYAELSDSPRANAEAFLDGLCKEKKLQKFSTKNGAIWFLPQTKQ